MVYSVLFIIVLILAVIMFIVETIYYYGVTKDRKEEERFHNDIKSGKIKLISKETYIDDYGTITERCVYVKELES